MDKPICLTPESNATALNRLLAPFFPRYRVLLELEREPAHLRVLLRNLILSHDRRFLFLRNQECACTQTTQLLHAYGNAGETYQGNVHRADRGLYAARYRWLDIKPVFEAHIALLFTFVRHPEKRAVSAFRNFFVDQTNIARRKHLKPMLARGYAPKGDAGRNFDVFLDYVADSFARDRLRTDTHWRLQVDNIAFHDIRFDRIGRVENYEADIRAIFAEGGAPGFPPDELLARKHNASRPVDFTVTPAQRARIEALWAPDYQAFNY